MKVKQGDPEPVVAKSGPNSLQNTYQKMVEEVEDYAIIFINKEGIIETWNRGAEKIKQYSAAEAIGNHFSMFYLPNDQAAQLPEKMLNTARTNGKSVHEGWRVRKDGTKFWGSITLTALHNENGEVFGFSKVTRDLTERKMAEDKLEGIAAELQKRNEELKESEERYHKMIAEVQDYAIILLDKEGNIQNWNAGAEKIKGYTVSEITGKNFRIFYRPEDQNAKLPERLIGEAATKGKAAHEGWRVRKDGTRFWGSVVITALHDDEGVVMGFSKVTRDLTERKLAEDQVQKYLKELEEQNRELERFAYVASHDLQEPLRKIRTFIDIVERNLGDEELVRNFFGKIKASAGRMSELIKAVLNYSLLGKKDEAVSIVDLNMILKSVVDDFEIIIEEKKGRVVSESLPPIRGNSLQINQLFSNLIGNALKFTDKNPEIKVSSTIVDSSRITDKPSSLASGKYLEIVFADNGIGFEPQFEKQIFSLFERLHGKHEYSGTGIGLALCKRIMENHGGFISASGKKGNGAMFNVYFPLEINDTITTSGNIDQAIF